jgi:hypothetical protein
MCNQDKLPKESFLVVEAVDKMAAVYHILLTSEEVISLSKKYDVMICRREYNTYPVLWLDDMGGSFRVR